MQTVADDMRDRVRSHSNPVTMTIIMFIVVITGWVWLDQNMRYNLGLLVVLGVITVVPGLFMWMNRGCLLAVLEEALIGQTRIRQQYLDLLAALEFDRDRTAAAALIGLLATDPGRWGLMRDHVEQYARAGLRHIAQCVLEGGSVFDEAEFDGILRQLKKVQEILQTQGSGAELGWLDDVHSIKDAADLEVYLHKPRLGGKLPEQ